MPIALCPATSRGMIIDKSYQSPFLAGGRGMETQYEGFT